MIAERQVLRALAAQGWAVVRPSQDSHVIVRAPDGWRTRVGLGHRGRGYGGALKGTVAELRRHGFVWPGGGR